MISISMSSVRVFSLYCFVFFLFLQIEDIMFLIFIKMITATPRQREIMPRGNAIYITLIPWDWMFTIPFWSLDISWESNVFASIKPVPRRRPADNPAFLISLFIVFLFFFILFKSFGIHLKKYTILCLVGVDVYVTVLVGGGSCSA